MRKDALSDAFVLISLIAQWEPGQHADDPDALLRGRNAGPRDCGGYAKPHEIAAVVHDFENRVVVHPKEAPPIDVRDTFCVLFHPPIGESG
jgi:hypothetical protein